MTLNQDPRLYADRQRYKFIAKTIKAGMAPFDPLDIRITVEEMIAGYKVTAQVSSLPDLRVAHVIDPAELDKPTAEDLLKEIGKVFFEEFRKHRIEPEVNVELGED